MWPRRKTRPPKYALCRGQFPAHQFEVCMLISECRISNLRLVIIFYCQVLRTKPPTVAQHVWTWLALPNAPTTVSQQVRALGAASKTRHASRHMRVAHPSSNRQADYITISLSTFLFPPLS